MMVEESEAAEHVKLIFDMYAKPETSFGDIARYFVEHDITFDGREPKRLTISYILRNPVYVQADLEVYLVFNLHKLHIVGRQLWIGLANQKEGPSGKTKQHNGSL